MEKKNTLVTSSELATAVRKKGLAFGLDSFQAAAVRALEEWTAAPEADPHPPVGAKGKPSLKSVPSPAMMPEGIEGLLKYWPRLRHDQRQLLTKVAEFFIPVVTTNEEGKQGGKKIKTPKSTRRVGQDTEATG